jgi:hypothetical protein
LRGPNELSDPIFAVLYDLQFLLFFEMEVEPIVSERPDDVIDILYQVRER